MLKLASSSCLEEENLLRCVACDGRMETTPPAAKERNVAASWMEFVSGCKTRWSALARSLFLGRRLWQQKCFDTKQALREAQLLLAQSEARCEEWEQRQQASAQQVAALQSQLAEPRPVALPVGAPPPGQQYGANLMALSVNLGRELGIRPAQRAMKIFFRG